MAFEEAMSNAKDNENVEMTLSSPGGNVLEAIAIYNSMKTYTKERGISFHGKVMGSAMSATTVIMCGMQTVEMGTGSLVMIHDPRINLFFSTVTTKTAAKMIEALSAIKESVLDIYEEETSMNRESLSKLMEEETFMSAKLAVESGFATSLFTPDQEEEEEKEEETAPETGKEEMKVDEELKAFLTDFKNSVETKFCAIEEKINAVENRNVEAQQKQVEDALTAARNRVEKLCQDGNVDPATKDVINASSDAEFINKFADSIKTNTPAPKGGTLGKETTMSNAPSATNKSLRLFTRPPGAKGYKPADEHTVEVAEAFAKGHDAFVNSIHNGEIESHIFGGFDNDSK